MEEETKRPGKSRRKKEEEPFEPFDILPGKIVTEKRVIS